MYNKRNRLGDRPGKISWQKHTHTHTHTHTHEHTQ